MINILFRSSGLLALLLVGSLAACNATQGIAVGAHDDHHTGNTAQTHERFTYSRPKMGVEARITLYAPDRETADRAVQAAFERIDAINDALSDYDPQSEVMQLVDAPVGTPYPVSEILLDALRRSKHIARGTDHAFDPSRGVLYHLWRRARRHDRWPTKHEIDIARDSGGFDKIRIDPHASTVTVLHPGLIFDFGAFGKGYAAQEAIDVLRTLGISASLVDLGGDLVVSNAPPDAPAWRVQIHTGRAAGEILNLTNTAVATSGDSEQFMIHEGERYSHIVDPRTGLPLQNAPAVTVIAPDGGLADALASAISVLGPDSADEIEREFPDVQVFVDGR